MKKSLVAIALFGAFAAQAQAQSAVTIYGTVDAGVSKTTNATAAIGSRNNNRLGFKGTEDLGNGLKAIFQLEMRFAPDTGMTEGAGTRPLFQGQSTVGLESAAFGKIRLGRALTAAQESILAFEPWNGIASPAGFNNSDMQMAGYKGDPLNFGGTNAVGVSSGSQNRWANAVFYNSPVFSGFQANATVATRENNAAVATTTKVTPYSLSGTYNDGMFAAVAAFERNAIEEKFWSVGGSVVAMPDLKLMATYSYQDQSATVPASADKTKSWLVGANYTMGPGKFLAGYGQKHPEAAGKIKQASLGYEYSLSKRTYVYADVSNKKPETVASTTFYGVGVSHNF